MNEESKSTIPTMTALTAIVQRIAQAQTTEDLLSILESDEWKVAGEIDKGMAGLALSIMGLSIGLKEILKRVEALESKREYDG